MMKTNKFQPKELREWTRGSWNLPADKLNISQISIDSRKISQGDAYLAIRGDNFDGHTFIPDAVDKGAVAIISEYEETTKVPSLIVKDTRTALGKIAAGYRKKMNIPIVGITGSSGKTTVKEMTACIFASVMNTSSTKGNLNNDIGLPLSILGMNPKTEFGVFEIGTNHPGEIAYLSKIMQPNIAVITNSGNAHIGNFESEQAIAQEKGELLKTIPDDGIAILNKDNKFFEYHKSLCKCKVLAVSLKSTADFQLKAIDGNKITIELPNHNTMEYSLPIPGQHNICNSMQAIAVAFSQQIPAEKTVNALNTFHISGMRWKTTQKNNVLYINDAYNANPDSMRSAIKTFAEKYSPDSSVIILGGMLELGNYAQQEHIKLGQFAASFAWNKVILVGQYSEAIKQGMMNKNFSNNKILVCHNNHEVIKSINNGWLDTASHVLLKASRGFKLEEILEGIK